MEHFDSFLSGRKPTARTAQVWREILTQLTEGIRKRRRLFNIDSSDSEDE
jgi:hypothetical protein